MEKDCPGMDWEYKDSLAGHYKGYYFTVIDEKVVMDIIQDNTNTIINGYYDKLYFWSDDYKDKIKNIIFTIDNDLTKYNNSNIVNGNIPWDVSRKEDNSIIAYFEKITENSYTLHIISDKIIDLPEDASHFFSNPSIETINGFNNISTANTIDISYMFSDCTNLKELNLVNNFDTSNVINMDSMFYECENLKKLVLGENFDTSKVINMSNMFAYCNKLLNLDLKSSFVINTTNTTDMLDNTGADNFTIYCSSAVESQIRALRPDINIEVKY